HRRRRARARDCRDGATASRRAASPPFGSRRRARGRRVRGREPDRRAAPVHRRWRRLRARGHGQRAGRQPLVAVGAGPRRRAGDAARRRRRTLGRVPAARRARPHRFPAARRAHRAAVRAVRAGRRAAAGGGADVSGDPRRRLWNEPVETLSRDAIARLQLQRLQRQVRYNYDRSPVHRRNFDEAGAQPEDIRTVEDFARIPVMTKDEHRRVQEESLERHGNPFALLACARPDEIVRINATSGTTGTPTLYTLTAHDVAVVNEMHARKYWRAGIRPGHVMLQALSLSMFTGGLPLSQGIMHLGACVVPVGIEGGTRRVVDVARITRPHAIIATPSFGRYLIEEAPRLTGRPARDLGLRRFFCAGEGGGSDPAIRRALAEGFDAKVFDHTGGGHAFHGVSCEAADEGAQGMHFVSED